MAIKLSVIVRTYERPNLLRRALLGIISQSRPVDEIIIVNNGGSPIAGKIIGDLLPTDSLGITQLSILDLNRPVSLGSAVNQGLSSATGDWVAIHDDDDFWPQSYVAETLACLETVDPSVVMLGAPVDQVFETPGEFLDFQESFRMSLSSGVEPGPLSLSRVVQHNLLPPIALWYKRLPLLSVGGYAEDIPVLEDWVANRALLLKNPGLMRTGTPVEYRVRETAHLDRSNPEKQNTVTSRLDEHHSTRAILMDRWLREEFEVGRFGPASFALLQENMENMQRIMAEGGTLLRILRKVKKLILS